MFNKSIYTFGIILRDYKLDELIGNLFDNNIVTIGRCWVWGWN